MATKVYLDFNKWVDLARADSGDPRGAPFKEVLAVTESGVNLGIADFPLSGNHYMEVIANNRFASRLKVTKVMRRLSQDRVMASLNQLVPCEIDRSLHNLFGVPRDPRTCQVFGLSLFEAMGQPSWRYEPPAGVALTP